MSTKKIASAIMLAMAAFALPSIAQGYHTVSLAWSPGMDVPQIVNAIDKNLWKAEGLQVKIVPFPSGREALEALLGGQVDFASVTEFPAIIGAMRNQKFGVLSTLSRYRSNRIIATNAIGAASMSSLAGRKVGTTVGTNVHFMLGWELKKAGVSAVIVNAAPSDLLPALMRSDIDAAVMFPTFFEAAKRSMGNRYVEIITPEYPTQFILVATPEVIEKHPEMVKRFLSALLKGEAMALKNPRATQEAIGRVVGKVLSPDAIRADWPNYQFRMLLDRELLNWMVREGQWIRDRGFVKNVEPSEQLFRSYIRDSALKSLTSDRVQFQ